MTERIIFCGTPHCEGWVSSRDEPCPRCGRVMNDLSADDRLHDLTAWGCVLEEQLKELEERVDDHE